MNASVNKTPQYLAAFPDFGEIDVGIPDGFADNSWKNDACPSFVKQLPDGRYLVLYIDYQCREKRETPNMDRFQLQLADQEMEYLRDIVSSENYGDIEDALKLKDPFPASSLNSIT